MKTFTKFFTMLAVAALFATGCVNEEPPYKEDPNPEPAGTTGYLSIGISARSGAMKAEHKKAKVNAANRSLRKLLAESCFSLCMILSQLSRPKIRRARQLR